MNVIQFTAKFENVKPINPLFSNCSMYILYTGLNRNNSFISKDTVEKAIPSLFNTPIIGEFLEYKENFGGHGGKIEITDKGINYVITTKPFGVVPESAVVRWEQVTEENGVINEYLVIDNAILWTGRYSELSDLFNQKYGLSMEIEVNKADFIKLNGSDVYEIQDFNFSGLCILGVDREGEGHVEPCFESASISAYSLNKDKFKSEFTQMIKELKFSLQLNDVVVAKEIQEGGINLVPDNIFALLEKYNLTESDLLEKEITYTDFSIEDLEVKLVEVFQAENKVDEVVEVVEEVEPSPVDFSLTSSQLADELRRELAAIETLTEVYWDDVYTCPRYWFRDSKPDQNLVVAMDEKNWYLVGFNYSINGDKVEVDSSSISRFKIDYSPMDLSEEENSELFSVFASKSKSDFMIQAKEKEMNKQFEIEKQEIANSSNVELEELQLKFTILQEQFSTLEIKATQFESELIAKSLVDRQEAETEIFESFSSELTEEEMKPVMEKSSEMSLDDITEKLFSIAGKKKFSFNLSTKNKDKSIGFQIPVVEKKSTGKAYDELFEKYNK